MSEFICYFGPIIAWGLVWAFILTWQQINFLKKDVRKLEDQVYNLKYPNSKN